MAGSLQRLLEPASVAVVGASADRTRIGGRVLDYLIRGGFEGRVHPVNPNRAEVQGLTAVAGVADLPDGIDVAVVALPAEATLTALRDCAARGIGGAIVFSSGFAETGPAGRAAEAELARIAAGSGMRIVGPNCLGVFNTVRRFYGTFTNTLDRIFPTPGPLSIVSQSGAFGTHLYYLARERGVGLRHWISTGNECDVEIGESLAYVVEDPGTEVVMLYVEGARNGPALTRAFARAAELGKPIVAIKVGRSELGAAAAASHTAAMAGGDAVYDAVFRHFGVHRARSAEEMVDVARLAAHGKRPTGTRLGVVTISGGAGILIADDAADRGLTLPAMPEAAQARLKALLPFASPRNPVDCTAQAFNDMDLFRRNLEVILDEGGYDAVIVFMTTVAGSPAIAPHLAETLRAVRRRHPERLIVLSLIADAELVAAYEAEDYIVYEDPSRAVAAVAALARARPEATASLPPLAPVAVPAGVLSEVDSRALLRAAGIPVVPERLVHSAEEAAGAARDWPRPLAFKIVSADIAHKSDIGGVLLGVEGEAAAAAAYEAVTGAARRHAPEARVDGVLVSPMVTGHVETIAGLSRDPVFGPVAMFGLGGIFAETIGDVAIRLAPFDEAAARDMIASIRGAALLAGARGRPAADVAALARALSDLSRLAVAAPGLDSLDINPLAVLPEGEGVVALDGLAVGRRDG